MALQRSATNGEPPPDPIGEAVAGSLSDVLAGAAIELHYAPNGADAPVTATSAGTAMATGAGPGDWQTTVLVRLNDRAARLVSPESRTPLGELLDTLPRAAVAARNALRLRHDDEEAVAVTPALRRAVRDIVAAQVLSRYLAARLATPPHPVPTSSPRQSSS